MPTFQIPDEDQISPQVQRLFFFLRELLIQMGYQDSMAALLATMTHLLRGSDDVAHDVDEIVQALHVARDLLKKKPKHAS